MFFNFWISVWLSVFHPTRFGLLFTRVNRKLVSSLIENLEKVIVVYVTPPQAFRTATEPSFFKSCLGPWYVKSKIFICQLSCSPFPGSHYPMRPLEIPGWEVLLQSDCSLYLLLWWDPEDDCNEYMKFSIFFLWFCPTLCHVVCSAYIVEEGPKFPRKTFLFPSFVASPSRERKCVVIVRPQAFLLV